MEQRYSVLESDPGRISVQRLQRIVNALGLEMMLQDKGEENGGPSLARAEMCGYAADPAQLVDEVIAHTPAVIARVASELPSGFPQQLAAQLLDGLARGARSLLAEG